MENAPPATLITICPKDEPLKKMEKTYILIHEKEEYKLELKYNDTQIEFNLYKIKSISNYYYIKILYLNELINSLVLTNRFDSIPKILKYLEKCLENKQIKLVIKEEIADLGLTKVNEIEEVIECHIELEKKTIPNEEIIDILVEEFQNLKTEKKDEIAPNILDKVKENEIKINQIITEKKEMEKKYKAEIESYKKEIELVKKDSKEKIESLTKEIETMKKDIKELKEYIFKNKKEEKKEEIKEKRNLLVTPRGNQLDEIKNINDKLIFKENISDFICNEKYINNGNKFSLFCVYTSISNKDDLLATYSADDKNFNINIYLLKNLNLYKNLKGTTNIITSLDYFLNNKEKKDYLLSTDKGDNIIIWDIVKNYEIKYRIRLNSYKGTIRSALLLFNIENKNCLIISSSGNSYTKIIDFDNGKDFVKIINSNKNETYKLIPWYHNNEYYIIEICNKKVVINNLLKNMVHAELISDKEEVHIGGCLYSDNYLCTSSYNGFVNIWDLISLKLNKTIEVQNGSLRDILYWNNDNIVVANQINSTIVIINVKDGKIINQIQTQHNPGVKSLQKFIDQNNTEILFTSSWDKTIRIWTKKK